MKFWFPPLIVLAVAGVWISSRWKQIDRIERETTILRDQIEFASSESGENRARSLIERGQRTEKNLESSQMNWSQLITLLAMSESDDSVDPRLIIEMQELIPQMEVDELRASLDEVETLDLQDTKDSLSEMIWMNGMAKKAPRLTLETLFSPERSRSGLPPFHTLHKAFSIWVKEDFDNALAWFDERITAGDFDSVALDPSNPMRQAFETTIVKVLLTKDPAAAERRIEAMPAGDRKRVLRKLPQDAYPVEPK